MSIELMSDRIEKLELLVAKMAEHLGMRLRGHPHPSIQECFEEVCDHYDMTLRELISRNQTKRVSRVRQTAVYVAYLLRDKSSSQSQIAMAIGGRDHSTVTHAIARIAMLRQIEKELDEDIEAIIYKLIHRNDAASSPVSSGSAPAISPSPDTPAGVEPQLQVGG